MSGHLRVALDTGALMPDPALTALRHRLVVMQPWDGVRLRAIKAARRGALVLCHKNLAGASIDPPGPGGLYSTGLTHEQAKPWLLRDPQGNLVTFTGYSHLYACDVGNPDYQRAWADAVISELRRTGFDGALFDNADLTMQYDFGSNPALRPAQYPTDAAWQLAMGSALKYIGGRFMVARKLAVPNIGGWGGNPTVGREWLRLVDGAMHEMFVKWGPTADTGYAAPARVLDDIDTLHHADKLNKFVLAVTHSAASDHQAALYGWCCALMGNRVFYCFAPGQPSYTYEAWIPEFDLKLGRPLGGMTYGEGMTLTRSYRHGVVTVNPETQTGEIIT